MTGKVTQIRIQGNLVGLSGLKEAFQEMAASTLTSTEILQEELFVRVAKHNYIPREAREAYKDALWREFRRFQGEELPPEVSDLLEVVVLGAGCFGCQTLYQQVIELLSQKGVKADVQYITDPARLRDFSVPHLPALLVNGRVALAGRLPDPMELEGLVLAGNIHQAGSPPESEENCPCS